MSGTDDDFLFAASEGDDLLNQSMIDSLFAPAPVAGPSSGLRALASSALVPHEKLPMLDVVLDRFIRSLSTSLRNFTSENTEVSIERVSSTRFSDFIQTLPLPALIGVVHIPEWDNYCLVTADSPLIYSIVDALLGGSRSGQPTRIEGRVFTTIETGLIAKMLRIVVEELGHAFAPLAKVQFILDRVETNPRFASVARPTNIAAVATMRVAMDDRGGRLSLLLPYATIEPIRELLLQRFMGEKFGRDSIWENHLARELRRTKLDVDAVLDEQTMTLGEVLDFRVGQTLALSIGKDDPIELRCGDVHIADAVIGRSGQHVAVQVTKISKPKGES